MGNFRKYRQMQKSEQEKIQDYQDNKPLLT